MFASFSLLYTVLLLPIFFHDADGCVASGVCGGINGCYDPNYYRPIQSASCDCLSTHACGRYGCYQAQNQVAAAPVRIQQDPNERFMQCCQKRRLPDACLEKCSFLTYTKEALMRMFMRQDGCPIEAAAELQFCAAQGQDHRECCVRNGVTTTTAGMKCLILCDQTPGKVVQLDMSYMPCYDRFDNMNGCFFYEMRKRNT